MSSAGQPRSHRQDGGRRALLLLLAVLLALAPILAPAQSRHAGTAGVDATTDTTMPPRHSQTLAQDTPPACPHCGNDHLSGCPCCEHAAPSALLPASADDDPALFTFAYPHANAVGLPAAPSEASFRPPRSVTD